MDDFLKMDVFFMVATLGTIAVSVLICLVLFHAYRILRTLDQIVGTVQEEAVALKEDFDAVRASAKREGKEVSRLVNLALASGKRLLKKKKS